jgi:hypothetical protein
LAVPKQTSLVAISKDFSTIETFPTVAVTTEAMLLSKILSGVKVLNCPWSNLRILKIKMFNLSNLTPNPATKKELINRRYKLFASDLEKAVIYSISHEVAQHSSATGHTLESL